MNALCSFVDNMSARIEFDDVLVDSDAWLHERTAGEIASLTDSLARFIDHYHAQPGQTYHHVANAVAAYIQTVDPDNTDRVDIHMINSEHVMNEPLAVTTFTHPRHGACVIAYEESYNWAGVPAVYADATGDSGCWYDFDQYDVCCPNDHGFTAQGRGVIDNRGRYHTRDELWPDGMFTDISDDDGHEQHTWHDSYALLCPTCGACCAVAMSPR